MFHQYNAVQYNGAQYNADAFYLLLSCSGTVTGADTDVSAPTKALDDSITSNDTRTNYNTRSAIDVLTLVDNVTKQVTNKTLSNRIRTNDWLGITQNPKTDTWG